MRVFGGIAKFQSFHAEKAELSRNGSRTMTVTIEALRKATPVIFHIHHPQYLDIKEGEGVTLDAKTSSCSPASRELRAVWFDAGPTDRVRTDDLRLKGRAAELTSLF